MSASFHGRSGSLSGKTALIELPLRSVRRFAGHSAISNFEGSCATALVSGTIESAWIVAKPPSHWIALCIIGEVSFRKIEATCNASLSVRFYKREPHFVAWGITTPVVLIKARCAEPRSQNKVTRTEVECLVKNRHVPTSFPFAYLPQSLRETSLAFQGGGKRERGNPPDK